MPGERDPAVRMVTMPAAPSDRRILVFAVAMVLAAGLLIAAALFFATGGGEGTPRQTKPLYLGLSKELRKSIRKGSPLYFANPFAGNGFWLDLEDGKFVALDLVLPDTSDCTVKWLGRRDSYVDCHGDDVTSRDLDRYQIELGKAGDQGQGVYVDLRKRISAPAVATTVPAPSG